MKCNVLLFLLGVMLFSVSNIVALNSGINPHQLKYWVIVLGAYVGGVLVANSF